MSRVAEGAEIGVVWRHDDGKAARGQQAVDLLHGSNHVRNMLDYMNGPHLAKGAVGKRKRILIKVGDHIGASIRVAINANCPRVLVDAAADIQYGERAS